MIVEAPALTDPKEPAHSHSIINRFPKPAWLKGMEKIDVTLYRRLYRQSRRPFTGAGYGAICAASTLSALSSIRLHLSARTDLTRPVPVSFAVILDRPSWPVDQRRDPRENSRRNAGRNPSTATTYMCGTEWRPQTRAFNSVVQPVAVMRQIPSVHRWFSRSATRASDAALHPVWATSRAPSPPGACRYSPRAGLLHTGSHKRWGQFIVSPSLAVSQVYSKADLPSPSSPSLIVQCCGLGLAG